MSKVRDLHRKWSRDPAYREAYADLAAEFTLTRSLLEARLGAGLTQAQLAERMETTQSVVARLECGRGNPSTRTLEALARSTGTRLRIYFEPVDQFADASVDELVDQLRRKLPSDKLLRLAQDFSYRNGEQTLDGRGADFREQGYLTLQQASELVKWKTARQWNNFRKRNRNEDVERLTATAARCADERPEFPEEAARILNELNAVSYPTASAFLTALHPEMFGILDVRTWRALHRLTGSSAFDRGKRTLFKPEEFRRYTLLLRRWSACEQAVSPRLIDKALWQYDREAMEELRQRRVVRSTTLADLSPVSLGRVAKPLRPDDDLLGEMLGDDPA